MSIQIITKEDFLQFKIELITELEKFITEKIETKKKWLRSRQIEEILDISSGTLTNYRVNGKITYSKIGDTYFYPIDEIHALLEKNASTPF